MEVKEDCNPCSISSIDNSVINLKDGFLFNLVPTSTYDVLVYLYLILVLISAQEDLYLGDGTDFLKS